MVLMQELNKSFREFKESEFKTKEKLIKESETTIETKDSECPNGECSDISNYDEIIKGLEDELENTADSEEKAEIEKEIAKLKVELLNTEVDECDASKIEECGTPKQDDKTLKEDSESQDDTRDLQSRVFSHYPDISEEDEDYLISLTYDELVQELKDRGWYEELEMDECTDPVVDENSKALKEDSDDTEDESKEEDSEDKEEKPLPCEILSSLADRIDSEDKPSYEEISSTLKEVAPQIKELIKGSEESDETKEDSDDTEEITEGEITSYIPKDKFEDMKKSNPLFNKFKNYRVNNDMTVDFTDDKGAINKYKFVKTQSSDSNGQPTWEAYLIKDNGQQDKPVVFNTTEVQESITECEIKSHKVTRFAPSIGAYFIEAETKDGLKYLVGKDYDSETKTLNEAEMFDTKENASNHFNSLLGKK